MCLTRRNECDTLNSVVDQHTQSSKGKEFNGNLPYNAERNKLSLRHDVDYVEMIRGLRYNSLGKHNTECPRKPYSAKYVGGGALAAPPDQYTTHMGVIKPDQLVRV